MGNRNMRVVTYFAASRHDTIDVCDDCADDPSNVEYLGRIVRGHHDGSCEACEAHTFAADCSEVVS